MSKYTSTLVAAVLLLAATSANAIIINFADMANSGEYGIQPLGIDVYGDGSLMLDIYGYDAAGEAHAYLDANGQGTDGNYYDGGLGVCSVINASSQCYPSNDDNVSDGEYLKFVFTGDTVILNNISFNNNHDGGFVGGTSSILIGETLAGASSFVTSNSGHVTETKVNPFNSAYISEFYVAYDNSQFYVESIEFVPEPAGLALLGLGLLGFGVARRAQR